jgi:hypothetical protein
MEVIYSISISPSTLSPYTLYIDAFNDDTEQLGVYYNINNGSYNYLGFITPYSDIDHYDNWTLPSVSAGDYVKIRINDSYEDNKESILNVDHIYIESTAGGGTQNNLINWNNSVDDLTGDDDVVSYRLYRSNINGSWGSPIYTETAVDLEYYFYLDLGKGSGDSTSWYYKLVAVDVYGSESVPKYVNEV